MAKKWNIKAESLKDEELGRKMDDFWKRGYSVHQHRTHSFELLSKFSHNQSLHTVTGRQTFSEGSTQAIKRKIRAQTLQRVPDGDIITQFDKNSIEQAQIEAIFEEKILVSEFDNKNMYKNLWRTWNLSYDFGFGAVLSGFERDVDGDSRTSYRLIGFNDIIPNPDCDYIEEAEWYIIRRYIPRSELENLIDDEGNCIDPTYNEDMVKYLVENQIKTGIDWRSSKQADKGKGVTPIESVEVRTLYNRGDDEFVTYVPQVRGWLRKTKNYDPRKDVPIHFMVLEPDYEYPYGCPIVLWTLGYQQAADVSLFSYIETILLALNPPIRAYGNLKPGKIQMKPRAWWAMGTNPKANGR